MLFDLRKTPMATIFQESRTLITLTLPMLFAQCFQVFTSFIDTKLVGQIDTKSVAALSIGETVFYLVFVALLGIGSSVSPILSHQYGKEGVSPNIGKTGQQAIWFGLLLGLSGLLLLLLLCTEPFLQTHSLAFIRFIAFGLPACMVYNVLGQYAASLSRPQPIMLVNLLGLALNIPLDYCLIHGLFGLPQMGASGCGLARCIVFWFNCTAMLCYIGCHQYYRPFGLLNQFSWPKLSSILPFFKLGFFTGVSYFLEMCLTAALIFIAAPLGLIYTASQGIITNCCGLIYMVPQSFSIALSIRIGKSIGNGLHQYARFLCGLGLSIGAAIALISCTLLIVLRHYIMDFYSNDPAVIVAGSVLLIVACFFQAAQTLQTVVAGALRGYKKTVIPMVVHIVSFLGIGVFGSYFLALSAKGTFLGYTLPLGIYGAWAGTTIGLSLATVLLLFYLSVLSRRLVGSKSH